MSWSTIIGIVLLLYAGYVVYKGRVTTSDDYGHSEWLNRSEKPVQFWFAVTVILVMAVLMLFNVFKI